MSLANYYGMDLHDMEVTTPEQAEGLRRYYQDAKSAVMPEYEFWLRHRPDVAKRRILFNMMCRSAEARQYMMPSLMGWMAYYAITGYEDGLLYQIVNAQNVGAPRVLIVDALAVAQMYADLNHLGSLATGGADEYLATYVDPTPRQVFPDGWAREPAAFASGLDFSTPELDPAEADRLRRWYERTLGEIPPYVERMLESQPRLLKAYRHRFEHALQGAPKQVMPYLMIHLNLLLGLRSGIREAFLLGRAFGMTREQLIDGIGRMVSYGGTASVSVAAELAGDVFAS